MEINENKIRKIKKLRLFLFGFLILCWTSIFVLGGNGVEVFFPIPISLGVLSIIAEIVLGIILNKETGGQKKNSDDNPRPYNGGSTNDYGPPPHKNVRETTDSFIKEIDDYISKEYPELPYDEAVLNINFSSDFLSDIRKTTIEMQRHLGISDYITITVNLRKLNDGSSLKLEAGHFSRTGVITAEIEIDSGLSKDMALACLAHEMSHFYQSFKGRQPYEDGSIKEEQFTDLLTYYLGFSKLVKNGYYSNASKLGYVESEDFRKIEEQYSSRTSSSGSYKKEKKDLKEIISVYEATIGEIVSLCRDLLSKYMPPDDKVFVKSINEKYNSDEVKEYISRINKNIDRRAKLNINMDQIGVEMKLEELMEDKVKVQRIYDYIFSK